MVRGEKRQKREDQMMLPASVKPPADLEMEATVLGEIMLENTVMQDIDTNVFRPDTFYLTSHRLIFEAMVELRDEKTAIDSLTLYNLLKKKEQIDEVGGAVYLSGLTQGVSSAANIDFHIKILIEKSIARGVITSAHEAAKAAYEGTADAFEVVEKSIADLVRLIPSNYPLVSDDISYWTNLAKKDINFLIQNKGKTEVSWGYTPFDDYMLGVQPDKTTILASRYNHGKTTLATNIARNLMLQKFGTSIFTYEDGAKDIVKKLLGMLTNINPKHFYRDVELELEKNKDKIFQALDKLSEQKISINPYEPDIDYIISRVAAQKQKDPSLKLAIIDNIQRFTSKMDYTNRKEVYKKMVEDLTDNIPKKLGVHILFLGQMELYHELSKENPMRIPTKIPDLEDSYLAGPVDNLVFLYNPDIAFIKAKKISKVVPEFMNEHFGTSAYKNKLIIIPMKARQNDAMSEPWLFNLNKQNLIINYEKTGKIITG